MLLLLFLNVVSHDLVFLGGFSFVFISASKYFQFLYQCIWIKRDTVKSLHLLKKSSKFWDIAWCLSTKSTLFRSAWPPEWSLLSVLDGRIFFVE
jgi:hypothetical protein